MTDSTTIPLSESTPNFSGGTNGNAEPETTASAQIRLDERESLLIEQAGVIAGLQGELKITRAVSADNLQAAAGFRNKLQATQTELSTVQQHLIAADKHADRRGTYACATTIIAVIFGILAMLSFSSVSGARSERDAALAECNAAEAEVSKLMAAPPIFNEELANSHEAKGYREGYEKGRVDEAFAVFTGDPNRVEIEATADGKVAVRRVTFKAEPLYEFDAEAAGMQGAAALSAQQRLDAADTKAAKKGTGR